MVPTVSGRSISIKGSIRTGEEQKGAPAEAGREDGRKTDAEELEHPEPDPLAILKAWDAYAASLEKKRPRIYSTLTSTRPEIRPDGSVMLLLNSEAQCDNFVRNIKPGLLDFILKETGLPSLEIVAGITESSRNGQKIYTDQDKLDYLMKKNPVLGELKTRFTLDFDE